MSSRDEQSKPNGHVISGSLEADRVATVDFEAGHEVFLCEWHRREGGGWVPDPTSGVGLTFREFDRLASLVNDQRSRSRS